MENKIHFNKFDEIEHLPLRIFNRTILMSNIMQDFGREIAKEYAELFNEAERKQMFIMNAFILQKGYNKAKEAVTKDMVFEEDKEEEYIEIDGLTA